MMHVRWESHLRQWKGKKVGREGSIGSFTRETGRLKATTTMPKPIHLRRNIVVPSATDDCYSSGRLPLHPGNEDFS